MKNEKFEKMIAGCFGSADKYFSGHSLDTKRASKMLIEVLQSGIGYEEFKTTIRDWLKQNSPHAKKDSAELRGQMMRVCRLRSYFGKD